MLRWRLAGIIICLCGTSLARPSSNTHPESDDIPSGYGFREFVDFTEQPNHGRPHLHMENINESTSNPSPKEEGHTILIMPDGRSYQKSVAASLKELSEAKKSIKIQPSQPASGISRKLTQVSEDTTIGVSTSSDLSCNGCGPDNRIQVTATTSYPYMTIGQLIGQLGTSTVGLECTGTLIGNSHVLTAAHCVFDINASRKMVANLNFAPARNGNDAPYGTLQWTRARVMSQFMNQPSYTTTAMNYDFALITLAKDATSGFLGLEVPPSNGETVKVDLTTAGYPGSKPSGTMWSSACGTTSVDYSVNNMFADVSQCANTGCSNILTHTCISSDGQSGSAMWDSSNNIRAVLTGKVTTSSGDAYNVATEIDTEVYNQIAAWYNEDGDSAGNGTLPLAPSGPGSQPTRKNPFVKFWTDNWGKAWFIAFVAALGLLALALVSCIIRSCCCSNRSAGKPRQRNSASNRSAPKSQQGLPQYNAHAHGAMPPLHNEGAVQFDSTRNQFIVNGQPYGQYQYPS